MNEYFLLLGYMEDEDGHNLDFSRPIPKGASEDEAVGMFIREIHQDTGVVFNSDVMWRIENHNGCPMVTDRYLINRDNNSLVDELLDERTDVDWTKVSWDVRHKGIG